MKIAAILEQKSQIDKLWETFWPNGISNPLTVIEQISYLFFIKELDDKQILAEKKALRTNKPIENPVFDETPKQQNMRWSKFKDFAPDTMFKIVQEDVFPFIKNMGGEKFAKYMKDAVFMIPASGLLSQAVDMISKLEMQDLDTKGGCAILYLKEKYPDMFMNEQLKNYFNNDTFFGFDFDYSMLRIASMNMMPHGHNNPNIDYQDSLSEEVEYEEVVYDLPKNILSQIQTLEDEVQEELKELLY